MGLNEQQPAVTEDSDQSTVKRIGRLPKKYIIETEGQKWLDGEGKRFDMLTKRNWLHPKRPFPKNPWFVPPAPVGNAVREEVYADYLSDPSKWTPRKLALKYQLSVLRIEAILRLKHLEKKQVADGYVLQKQFSQQMEELLAAGSGEEPIIRESPDGHSLSSDSKSSKGMSVSVYQASIGKSSKSADNSGNTHKQLTADDFKRRPDGNYIMPLSGVIEEPESPPTIIESQNPRECNRRFKFIVADISDGANEDSAQMLVRDNDGTLRTATRAERRMHHHLYPLRQPSEIENDTCAELWRV